MTRAPLWWTPPEKGPPSPEVVECVARKLYDAEVAGSLFLDLAWEELHEDERDDVRHQVRAVFAVVESLSPGSLRALEPHSPDAVHGCKAEERRGSFEPEKDFESWPLTGT